MRPVFLVLAGLLCYTGCGPEAESVNELNMRTVTLPDGREIRAEVLMTQAELKRGMMFRDPLPQGRGMLFIHAKPAPYRYWMGNIKAPLDIIFMDAERHIVEISADTPLCTSKPEECPVYGGHYMEQYVLELGAGEAKRLGLRNGQTLAF